MFFLKYIKTEGEYKSYIEGDPILPNVSLTIDDDVVHYTELTCEEFETYKVSNVSYSSEVGGNDTSFQMSFDYIKTEINKMCIETVTEGSDAVDVYIGKNPSSSARTVTGEYDYHGTKIPYTVTQTGVEGELLCKYNPTVKGWVSVCTDTSNFSEMYVDGVKQSMITQNYYFNEVGEHTIRYVLKNPNVTSTMFAGCTGLTEIIMSDGVASVEENAFTGCTSLSSATLPDGITEIKHRLFSGCTSLTSVNIPDSVTKISGQSFAYCTSLSSITIPNGVIGISQTAFEHCHALTSVTIPDSVTFLAPFAFQYCSGLTSIVIGSGVTEIKQSTFNYCNSLTSLTIGNSVTSIGDYAFGNCNNLLSLTIPDSVTEIGKYAFQRCTKLASLTLGSSLENIGSSAFMYPYALSSITSNAMTAPTISSNTFSSVKSGGTLYVPTGATGYEDWLNKLSGWTIEYF